MKSWSHAFATALDAMAAATTAKVAAAAIRGLLNITDVIGPSLLALLVQL